MISNRDMVEKALLLGVVKAKNWNLIIENDLSKMFFTTTNQRLYDYIKDYAVENNYPDFPVLCYEFHIDDITLQECLNVEDLQGLCRIIRNDYVTNAIINGMQELNEHQDELEDEPEKFVNRLGQLHKEVSGITYSCKSVDLFKDINKILEIDESDVISSGFKELDKVLKGWKRGEELVVFMGRTGQGKSWLGLKFAMAAVEQGETVGIYSGEMSVEQLQERIICCAKATPTTTKQEAADYVASKSEHIKVITQRELRRRANIDDIERMIVRDKLTMLVVDQLSLMDDTTSKPGTPMRQQYGNISMDLFSLSVRFKIPIILLVQSNRQGGEQKDGPALENIAESDAVAQNATRVISMKNEQGVLTLKVLKNRYGNSNMVQKYNVDYGLNKYNPIQEFNAQTSNTNRKVKNYGEMFRNNRSF